MKTILIIGTYDTKNDELEYIQKVIHSQGAETLAMDVSILGDPKMLTDYSKHEVIEAGGNSIKDAIDADNENKAMQMMAKGCTKLTQDLCANGKFDGVIILGGSMGTDLALDVCSGLPIGIPKYIVSTIAFSPLIPPERLAADTQMILWAGGLYGLNEICKLSLSQAAGAVLGAAKAVDNSKKSKPIVGMTSLGKTALKYMVTLKPALEERGFQVAVFHATGMGGRAFESLASQEKFSCVFDFCTQELGNHIHGSNISAGSDRMTNAGRNGVPQIIAPGCYDLVDIIGWQEIDEKWIDHESHSHNRLITSIVLNEEERKKVARAHTQQLALAESPTAFILPKGGCGEWDREGAPLNNPQGLSAFCDELIKTMPKQIDFHQINGHINDDEFCKLAIKIFDDWCAEGIIKLPN